MSTTSNNNNMDNIEILAEATALHLAPLLHTPDNFGLAWHDPKGKRHIRVFGGEGVEEALRELYPTGVLDDEFVMATLVPDSFMLVMTSWGHRQHYKHNTVDGRTYLRVCGPSTPPEQPHWEQWLKFNRITEALKALEDEVNGCIQWPSNGYVGKPEDNAFCSWEDMPAMQVHEKHLMQLLDYSHSLPTGAVVGKTWRRKGELKDGEQRWWVMRYVPVPQEHRDIFPGDDDLLAVMAWKVEIVVKMPGETLPMSDDTRTRLEATANNLKSETLFPKKVEAAKHMFEGVESLPIQDLETGGAGVHKVEAVTTLPTAPLLEKLRYHQGKMSNVAYTELERLGHGFCALACAAELDARCENAGIHRNIDGTFSIQPCTLSVEEMGERISLINYFTHKEK